jgi:hypothetical protein
MDDLISFTQLPNDTPFTPRSDLLLIDAARVDNPTAQGLWGFVSNARYSNKHPVYDISGQKLGHLKGGVMDVGYTFEAIYLGHKEFAIASVPLNSRSDSLVRVRPVGSYLFRPSLGQRFAVTESLNLGRDWVSGNNSIHVFRQLDKLNNNILFVSNYGFIVVDRHDFEPIKRVTFDHGYGALKGFGISPKRPILAVVFSTYSKTDKLDNTYLYKNFVTLYDMAEGNKMGETALPGDKETSWNVTFSECGRQIRVSNGQTHLTFDMK